MNHVNLVAAKKVAHNFNSVHKEQAFLGRS